MKKKYKKYKVHKKRKENKSSSFSINGPTVYRTNASYIYYPHSSTTHTMYIKDITDVEVIDVVMPIDEFAKVTVYTKDNVCIDGNFFKRYYLNYMDRDKLYSIREENLILMYFIEINSENRRTGNDPRLFIFSGIKLYDNYISITKTLFSALSDIELVFDEKKINTNLITKNRGNCVLSFAEKKYAVKACSLLAEAMIQNSEVLLL